MSLDDETPTQYFGPDPVTFTAIGATGKTIQMTQERARRLIAEGVPEYKFTGLLPDTGHVKGCAFGRTARCTCMYLIQWDKTPAYTAPTWSAEEAREKLFATEFTAQDANGHPIGATVTMTPVEGDGAKDYIEMPGGWCVPKDQAIDPISTWPAPDTPFEDNYAEEPVRFERGGIKYPHSGWPVADTLFDDGEECAKLFKEPGHLTPGEVISIPEAGRMVTAFNPDPASYLQPAPFPMEEKDYHPVVTKPGIKALTVDGQIWEPRQLRLDEELKTRFWHKEFKALQRRYWWVLGFAAVNGACLAATTWQLMNR